MTAPAQGSINRMISVKNCPYWFSLLLQVLAGTGLWSVQSTPAWAQTAYTVTVLEQTWRDPARQRDLPVKLRLPTARQSTERFPVIIFSHGLGGSREAGTHWGEFWSAHGYVVVHVQHPGSDESIVEAQQTPAQNQQALRKAASGEQLRQRLADIKFILDELALRTEFRHADLSRIGMSGHSFGALTTQILVGQSIGAASTRLADARIKAAIAFSPSVRNRIDAETQFSEVKLPFMSVTGTMDGDWYGRTVAPEERMRPFYAMPADGNKFLVIFHKGDHMVFSGHTRGANRLRPAEAVAEEARIIRLTQMLTLAFWDAHLRHMPSAQQWLETSAARALRPEDRFEQR